MKKRKLINVIIICIIASAIVNVQGFLFLGTLIDDYIKRNLPSVLKKLGLSSDYNIENIKNNNYRTLEKAMSYIKQ